MTKQTKRAFVLSSLVHALGLTGFVFAGVLSNCAEEEPEDIVLTLLASPPPASVSPPAPTPPRPVMPTPPPPKPKPKPVTPKPTPKPKPKPVTTKPKPKPTPKPRPKPVKPPDPPRKISLEQFRKQHPLPKTPRQPAPPRVTPSNIDPSKFTVDVSTPRPVVNRDPNERDRYLSSAFAKIKRNWLRLKASANLRSQGAGVVEVTVKFEIGSGGELRAPRLVRPSSYPEFDRLVLQAVRGISNVGRPPFRISESLTMKFRLN